MDGRPGSRDGWWRALGWSFLVGGVFDLLFGIGILVAAERLAPILGVTLPAPRLYLDLNGLFLVALGMIYILIFLDPRRLAPVAAVATLLRFAGAALFVASVLAGRGDDAFFNFAKADAVFALVHVFLLHKAAGSLTAALFSSESALSRRG